MAAPKSSILKTPQVLITLSPSGDLIAELPGVNGMRRPVPLSQSECYLDLKRILQAQLNNKIQVGEDGAPTQHQVRHWEKHGPLFFKHLVISHDDEILGSVKAESETAALTIAEFRFGRENIKKLETKGDPITAPGYISDPSCPFCLSEGRFPPGKNRERAIRGLTDSEAIILGLTSRGYREGKPNVWHKPNQGKPDPVLIIRGKPYSQKRVRWSDEAISDLIIDGKIEALRIKYEPKAKAREPKTILKRDGIVVKIMPARGKARKKTENPQSHSAVRKAVENLKNLDIEI